MTTVSVYPVRYDDQSTVGTENNEKHCRRGEKRILGWFEVQGHGAQAQPGDEQKTSGRPIGQLKPLRPTPKLRQM